IPRLPDHTGAAFPSVRTAEHDLIGSTALLPLPPRAALFPYTTLFRSQDLNLRPLGYEPSELPSCSTPRRLRLRHYVPLTSGCKRSEEHTSELQSRFDLVCRLLLEKKNRARRHVSHRSLSGFRPPSPPV